MCGLYRSTTCNKRFGFHLSKSTLLGILECCNINIDSHRCPYITSIPGKVQTTTVAATSVRTANAACSWAPRQKTPNTKVPAALNIPITAPASKLINLTDRPAEPPWKQSANAKGRN